MSAPPGPWGHPRTRSTATIAISVVISVALTLVAIYVLSGGSLLAAKSPSPGYVELQGIVAHFSYHNGSWPVFGAQEVYPAPFPITLVGGSTVVFDNVTWTHDVPNETLGVYWNLSSPVPTTSGCIPTSDPSCHAALNWTSGVEQPCGTGADVTWDLAVVVPDPAPSFPSGGWGINLMVNVTASACS